MAASLPLAAAGLAPELGARPSSVPGATALATPAREPALGALPGSVSPRVTAPNWINLTAPGAAAPPPVGFGASLAFDPLEQVYLYFGGGSVSSLVSNQTWVFAHGHWQNETNPHDSPPARAEGAMDFDANAGAVLLFGGESAVSYLDDTWSWSGGIWTNITSLSSAAPSARAGASLAFDPANDTNATLLFGGYSNSGALNDTWLWQPGSGWTQALPTVTPAARELGSMGFDGSLGALVLFSGSEVCTSSSCPMNDTWEWYSGTWWQVVSSPSPAGRAAAFLTGDPAIGGMLLFGGDSDANSSYLADTWSFTGSRWAELSPADQPSARFLAAGAPETTGAAPLLFSGTNNFGVSLGFTDTWTYEVSPVVTVTAGASEEGAPASVTVAVAGGAAPYSVALRFGDGANGSAVLNSGPATLLHSYLGAGTFPLSAQVTDAMGVTAIGNGSISVTAGPAAKISVSAPGTDVGKPIQFTEVTVSPGLVPDHYLWNWGDGTSTAAPNSSHTYALAGTFHATLTISDSAGGSAMSSVAVLVSAAPSVQIASTPAAARAGSTEILSANVSAGTAPFSYSWSLGDGTWSTNPAPAHTFAAPGTFTVQLWVNDSAGASAHASTSLSVAKGSNNTGGTGTGSGSSSSPPTPVWFWAGIGALALIAVVGGVLLVRRPPKPAPS